MENDHLVDIVKHITICNYYYKFVIWFENFEEKLQLSGDLSSFIKMDAFATPPEKIVWLRIITNLFVVDGTCAMIKEFTKNGENYITAAFAMDFQYNGISP